MIRRSFYFLCDLSNLVRLLLWRATLELTILVLLLVQALILKFLTTPQK